MRFVKGESSKIFHHIFQRYAEVRKIFNIPKDIFNKISDENISDIHLTINENSDVTILESISDFCENLEVISIKVKLIYLNEILQILQSYNTVKKIIINKNEILDDNEITNTTIEQFFKLILKENVEHLTIFENVIEHLNDDINITCRRLRMFDERFSFTDIDHNAILSSISPCTQMERNLNFKTSYISILIRNSKIKYLVFVENLCKCHKIIEDYLLENNCICYTPPINQKQKEKLIIFNLKYVNHLNKFLPLFVKLNEIEIINDEIFLMKFEMNLKRQNLYNFFEKDIKTIHIVTKNEEETVLIKIKARMLKTILKFVEEKTKLRILWDKNGNDIKKLGNNNHSKNEIYDLLEYLECCSQNLVTIKISNCLLVNSYRITLIKSLKKFSLLQEFDISKNFLNQLNLEDIINGLVNNQSNLYILNLSSCNLVVSDVKQLKTNLLQFTKLKDLNISNNVISEISVSGLLKGLLNCKKTC